MEIMLKMVFVVTLISILIELVLTKFKRLENINLYDFGSSSAYTLVFLYFTHNYFMAIILFPLIWCMRSKRDDPFHSYIPLILAILIHLA